VDYAHIARNKSLLEEEFSSLFGLLQEKATEDKKEFWLYCYYCACLLESYHKAYGQSEKEAHYQDVRSQIKNRLKNVKAAASSEQGFIDSLYQSFIDGFRNLAKTPLHISKIRDEVAYSNLCRLQWVFLRITVNQGLMAAQSLQLIEKLDALLGTHTNVDKIISTLNMPNGVLNYFSVGLFLMRFMIDAGVLVRHTFFPSEEEKKLPMYERFKAEIAKRHCNFLNDLVWSAVNLLTNFNRVFGISDPVAGYLIAAFLVFDVAMVLYKHALAKKEYMTKKAQYEAEVVKYMGSTDLSEKERLVHCGMLHEQIAGLDRNWQAKQSTYYFVAAAASLLMLGFSASMIVASPVLVACSFFVCAVGVAMYQSSGAYSAFKEKSLLLEQSERSGVKLAMARKEYELARNDFIKAMIKNTVIPIVLITTYAICWPAAVLMTVALMGYELLHAFNKHEGNKEVSMLAQEPVCAPAM
jgi:hypothetical protein